MSAKIFLAMLFVLSCLMACTGKDQVETKTTGDTGKAIEKFGETPKPSEVPVAKRTKLTDRDVRIIYLPPATVASSRYFGNEPEHHAAAAMDKFVRENDLPNTKPDMRLYGFNQPNPGYNGVEQHGYEFWVTIPDDMDVPAPLTKKRFAGGLYAAHMISMGAFEEWGWLWEWAQHNDNYEANLLDDDGEFMFGLLEEHLNYRNYVNKSGDEKHKNIQLDLLIPIKEKTK